MSIARRLSSVLLAASFIALVLAGCGTAKTAGKSHASTATISAPTRAATATSVATVAAVATTARTPTPTPTRTPRPTPTSAPKPTTAATGPKTTFGDGTWQVGKQIAPGTYWSGGASFCYWEREKDLSGSMNAILANDTPQGQDIVTILPMDVGFKSQGCGTWKPIASLPPHQPATASFGDGLYKVGSQVTAGTWSAPGGSNCYWARLNGFSDPMTNTIANDLPSGPVSVTISGTDVAFQTHGCGTWTHQGG